jgi:hypothetical protein
MGNRANFGIKVDDKNVLYLYQHWAPEHLFKQYANAIKFALPRIKVGDIAYSTRILISQIIGNEWNSEYGYGISLNQPYFDEHRLVVIDLTTGLVHLYERGEEPLEDRRKIVSWGVEKFINKYAD